MNFAKVTCPHCKETFAIGGNLKPPEPVMCPHCDKAVTIWDMPMVEITPQPKPRTVEMKLEISTTGEIKMQTRSNNATLHDVLTMLEYVKHITLHQMMDRKGSYTNMFETGKPKPGPDSGVKL